MKLIFSHPVEIPGISDYSSTTLSPATAPYVHMPHRKLDQVIAALDAIIENAIRTNSTDGIFAAVYRRVTVEVQRGIQQGAFNDGERMADLDVAFAQRYLDAHAGYAQQLTVTRSWLRAFDASQEKKLIILQHLFLGINAHINLDLGIAAASILPPDRIEFFQDDFNTINAILSNLVDEVQLKIATVSPWIGLLDLVGGRKDEKFADFSMKVARDEAWKTALRLSKTKSDRLEEEIVFIDDVVSTLAKLIVKPGRLSRWVLRCIRLRESKDIAKIIGVLR